MKRVSLALPAAALLLAGAARGLVQFRRHPRSAAPDAAPPPALAYRPERRPRRRDDLPRRAGTAASLSRIQREGDDALRRHLRRRESPEGDLPRPVARPRPRASSSSDGTCCAFPSAGAASSRSRSSTPRRGCRSSTPCSPWRTSTRSTSSSTCTRTRTARRSARTASPSGRSSLRPRSSSRVPTTTRGASPGRC